MTICDYKDIFKKIILTVVFIFSSVIFLGEVNADWVLIYECDEIKNYSLEKMSSSGKIQLPKGWEMNFADPSIYEDFCININKIGALVDEDNDKKGFHYCEASYQRGWDMRKPNESNLYSGGTRTITCCKNDYPWAKDVQTDYCCNTVWDKKGDVASFLRAHCIPKAEAKHATLIDAEAQGILTLSEIKRLCPIDRCLIRRVTGELLEEPRVVSSPDAARLEYGCINTGASWGSRNSDTTYVCLKGNAMEEVKYKQHQRVLSDVIINVCADFKDMAEIELCLNCYAAHEANTYSSLGCIEATQSGLVIRILQIGIGIISAVAIARIMQAAILRQSADPTKIQESYDIVVSVVIGFVVMLASVMLLHFIGVNILGLLPFDFLK